MLNKIILKLSVFVISMAATNLTLADPTADLQVVGEARLKFLFWQVYDSTLFSNSGTYQELEPNLALKISYRRKDKRRATNTKNQRRVAENVIAFFADRGMAPLP